MGIRQKRGLPDVAVAYMRAPKDEQKLSPEAQRSTIEVWAARESAHVASWHIDQGVRSVTPLEERKALMEAFEAIRVHRAGILVVARRDRIARDVLIAGGFQAAVAKRGALVVSAAGEGNGDQPADQFMRTIVDGAAQYERAMIKARTKAALASKRTKGERISGPIPYGFALAADGTHPTDGQGRRRCSGECLGCLHLVPVEAEQAAIVRVDELAIAGRTLSSIAATLAEEGKVSRSGRAFLPEQISRMLSRRAS
jgi:DNA invertase Pin-like site-specific DNA recombinase